MTDDTSSKQWQTVFRPYLFQNKVALVTGGGSGIGRSIAFELAMLGATVCIASRDRDKCLAAAKEMNDEVIRRRQLVLCPLPESSHGIVVVGPSTSIRDEDQVNELVSFLSNILLLLRHMLINYWIILYYLSILCHPK